MESVSTEDKLELELAELELKEDASFLEKSVFKITYEMAKRPVAIFTCMFAFILFIVVVTLATGIGALSDSSNFDWIICK